MIKENMYEGLAYYFYEYSGIAEFGFFQVRRYTWSNIMFQCKTKFFYGYNTEIDKEISSNQLHGQNMVKTQFENWYLDVNELKSKRKLIIKTIFEARKCY